MNPWQLMFLQSKANDNVYHGDSLATYHWAWPRGTWFQNRLSYLRRRRWDELGNALIEDISIVSDSSQRPQPVNSPGL